MALTKVNRGGLNTGISDASDATAITIDSSERVGIGVTSPTQALHVDEPTSNNQACIINSSLSSFQGQVLVIKSVRTTTNSSFNFLYTSYCFLDVETNCSGTWTPFVA